MLAAMFSGLLESGDDDGSSVIDDGGGVGLAVDSDGAYIIDRDGKLRWGDIANADVEKAIGHLLAK